MKPRHTDREGRLGPAVVDREGRLGPAVVDREGRLGPAAVARAARRYLLCAALLLPGLGGCGEALFEELRHHLHVVRKEVADLRAQVEEQNRRARQLQEEVSDGLSIALCRPELGQLLKDVEKECSTLSADKPSTDKPGAAKASAAKSGTEICSTQKIGPAVIAADPEHKGRFLKMLSYLRHEVIYVPKDGKGVLRHREERLARMAQQTALPKTLFLVVSHPGPGMSETEAVKRARLIEALLEKNKVPKERVRRWLYAFQPTKKDIERPMDLPGTGEPEDLTQGVWVFRADC